MHLYYQSLSKSIVVEGSDRIESIGICNSTQYSNPILLPSHYNPLPVHQVLQSKQNVDQA
uniref:Uncharacterized protein n=1 Tax=Meloidogyne enterolobii TaxID=390850 RepID=A0A6V7VLQ2_MELEN|nr:unnamed protein product [Meloidogyne enterolobii]